MMHPSVVFSVDQVDFGVDLFTYRAHVSRMGSTPALVQRRNWEQKPLQGMARFSPALEHGGVATHSQSSSRSRCS